MMFAGIYYSTQRLCKARMASMTRFQASTSGAGSSSSSAAAITLPLGLLSRSGIRRTHLAHQHRVAVIWVVFAINFFWTLA
jgi:cytochrome c oxidase cbb3-type subunit I/II